MATFHLMRILRQQIAMLDLRLTSFNFPYHTKSKERRKKKKECI